MRSQSLRAPFLCCEVHAQCGACFSEQQNPARCKWYLAAVFRTFHDREVIRRAVDLFQKLTPKRERIIVVLLDQFCVFSSQLPAGKHALSGDWDQRCSVHPVRGREVTVYLPRSLAFAQLPVKSCIFVQHPELWLPGLAIAPVCVATWDSRRCGTAWGSVMSPIAAAC